MIKKIQAEHVRLGMYIHEIRGNWLEHPFWRTSFKLDDEKDLDKLLSCSFDEIWIDTSKGLDVLEAEEASAPPKRIVKEVTRPVKKKPAPVSLAEELDSAKKIHTSALSHLCL